MSHPDGLDQSAADRAKVYSGKLADSLAGLIPGGPLLAQLLQDAAMPEDRVDRIVARLRSLDERMKKGDGRLDALEEVAAITQLSTAALRASADVGPARKHKILDLLTVGLDGGARETAYAVEALTRLNSLTEIHLIMLASFHPRFSEDAAWVAEHYDLIGDPFGIPAMGPSRGVPPGRGLGSHPASPDGEAAKAQLVGQGLLRALPVFIWVDGGPGQSRNVQLLTLTDLGNRVLQMVLG